MPFSLHRIPSPPLTARLQNTLPGPGKTFQRGSQSVAKLKIKYSKFVPGSLWERIPTWGWEWAWEEGIVCRDPEGKGQGSNIRKGNKDQTVGKENKDQTLRKGTGIKHLEGGRDQALGKGTRIRHWEREQDTGERVRDQTLGRGQGSDRPQRLERQRGTKAGTGKRIGILSQFSSPLQCPTLQTWSGAMERASQAPQPSQLEGVLRSLNRDQQCFGAEESGLDPQNVNQTCERRALTPREEPGSPKYRELSPCRVRTRMGAIPPG